MNINKVPHFDPFSFATGLGKASVGFDQVLKRMNTIADALPKIPSYPPYNIRKVDENKYVIEIAVAGFGKQDIEIEMHDGVLTIKGNNSVDQSTEDYIFKGIADRAFTRQFTLADSVEVKNADLINGLLKIWLERFIPEEKKPKKINIGEDSAKTDKQFLSERELKDLGITRGNIPFIAADAIRKSL